MVGFVLTACGIPLTLASNNVAVLLE